MTRCEEKDADDADELADKLMDKAEECKSVNPKAYRTTLCDIFGGTPVNTRLAFQYLMKLPFKGYVTTNFDPLLCVAGKLFGFEDLYVYPDLHEACLYRDPRPIFHIHGLATQTTRSNGGDLILARSDFEAAYKGMVRSFLIQLLTYHPILFLGCRLEEPDIQETLRRVHDIHASIKRERRQVRFPRRYMLLANKRKPGQDTRDGRQLVPDVNKERAEVQRLRNVAKERAEVQRLRDMDIEVVRYDPCDRRHKEVEQLLAHLCDLVGMSVTPEAKLGFPERGPL